jgi:hypothetical protein
MSGLESLFVGTKAASTIYYARMQADRIELPLNQVVTINYSCTGIDPWDAPRAFQTLRNNHFAPFCRRPGRGKTRDFACVPTYAFAFENERDGQPFLTMNPGDPHNVHVHWHVHVRPARFHEFEGSVWEWLKQTAGDYEANAIMITGPKSVGYLNKGAREKDAKLYAKGHEAEPQGIICGGRRTGTTVNIGPSARRAKDRELSIKRRLPVINGTPYFKRAAGE